MKKAVHPIIVIGMHRSGTTMIAKMLSAMGLFIGWDLEENYEARYFYNINRQILQAFNGSWDNPRVIDNLLNHPDIFKKITYTLQNDLDSFESFLYLGPRLYIRYRSALKLDFPWGWKEPCNTFMLPLWLDIFPHAKVVNIYRNGIDVAKSLATRENKRINEILGDSDCVKKKILSQLNQLKKYGFLLYNIRKVQSMYRRINPLGKYVSFRVESCISIEKGFELWCTYIERAFKNIEDIQNDVLNIKYEDFLINPEHYLNELKIFCSLQFPINKIHLIANEVNKERRFAFKDNETLLELYDIAKNNNWMRKLGYNDELF